MSERGVESVLDVGRFLWGCLGEGGWRRREFGGVNLDRRLG